MDSRCINTIRCLAADVVQKANSGHPGAPMGCAPIAHLLWSQIMNYSPRNPDFPDRDRFVLSNGHACALQYIMLHLAGYDLTMEDLKQFRQLHSRTPGHPENILTAGVEVSTGPLGQGISNAVGMAIAERHLAAVFNRPDFPVVDHYTYVVCGDGCLQEGVSAETASLAGHLGLGKLIVFYDDNHVTIDGDTDLSFSEDVLARYAAYGWHVQQVADGDEDLGAIAAAVEAAKSETSRPSIIKIRTTIGIGSSKAGTADVHGAPLGKADVAEVKRKYGFDPEQSFVVPEEVGRHYEEAAARAARKEEAWNEMFARYREAHPDLAKDLQRRLNGELPADWVSALPDFSPSDKPTATRNSSGAVLNAIANAVPELMGGSADLTPSNKTQLKCTGDYSQGTPQHRYVRFGVREHGMSAIANGMAAHGGVIPFVATFLNFIGYAMGAVRLSALSELRVLYIATHDTIALGEDGPTHQPIEMLPALRATPNMLVLRPADAREVAGAYKVAMERKKGPSVLALSRQDTPTLARTSVDKVALGAYVVGTFVDGEESGEDAAPELIMISTGTEVATCMAAARHVPGTVRVVSMPSVELFEAQPRDYQRSVLVPGVPTLSVEPAAQHGWHKYAHGHVCMTTFGTSAPGELALEHFGFSTEGIADKARRLKEFYAGRPAPDLTDAPGAM